LSKPNNLGFTIHFYSSGPPWLSKNNTCPIAWVRCFCVVLCCSITPASENAQSPAWIYLHCPCRISLYPAGSRAMTWVVRVGPASDITIARIMLD